MGTINFKTSSWHYRIALYSCNEYEHKVPTNFCLYFWVVIKGILCRLIDLLFTGFVIGMFIIYPLYYIIDGYIKGLYESPNELLMFVTICDIIIIGVILLGYFMQIILPKIRDRLKWWKVKKVSVLNDSFIRVWWNSFKDKTCFKIEFGD